MKTDVHTFHCRCGRRSPRLDSREKARAWHAAHIREECEARRATSPRRLDWGDLDELQAHAERMKPVDPSVNSTSIGRAGWRDASLEGSWGRRKGGRALWTSGNCLKGCVATLLQCDIKRVPDPTSDFAHEDWLERYDKRLRAACGVRLEKIPRGGCPPIDRNSWIAVLDAGAVNHGVLAREHRIWHDPDNGRLNGLEVPRDRLLFGLRLEHANARKLGRWGEPLEA
jgi:hypothetical protein